MPSRNVLKLDTPETYYHVYARGASKAPIFLSREDCSAFFGLLARYLSVKPTKDPMGREYPHLRGSVKIAAYCLMTNHFHILAYQIKACGLSALMHGVMTSYSRYFNAKYKRSGPLFESRYKASTIMDDAYLQHITRYIHLNPKNWRSYPYSSLSAYLGSVPEEWLQPEGILSLFGGSKDYLEFVQDYTEHKAMLDEIKHQLADT